MKAVLQRVSGAGVTVTGEEVSRIGTGLLVLLGVDRTDNGDDVEKLAVKIIGLRIFEDAGGKMNRSLVDIGGELLLVSQFTLLADCTKGRRPSFFDAMPPREANSLVEAFATRVENSGITVKQGVFGATMAVDLINDGPVTIMLDSADKRTK
jgi:D-aminoacyl-tRNA deacylase